MVRQNKNVSVFLHTDYLPGRGACHRALNSGSGVIILPQKTLFEAGSIGRPDKSPG
jgi:hypothetical protein